jgi:hypothetical protein
MCFIRPGLTQWQCLMCRLKVTERSAYQHIGLWPQRHTIYISSINKKTSDDLASLAPYRDTETWREQVRPVGLSGSKHAASCTQYPHNFNRRCAAGTTEGSEFGLWFLLSTSYRPSLLANGRGQAYEGGPKNNRNRPAAHACFIVTSCAAR